MTMKQARKLHRRTFKSLAKGGHREDYVPFRTFIREAAPSADSPKLQEILKQ